MNVRVEAEVRATENPDKVRQAIQQLFSVDVRLLQMGDSQVARGEGGGEALDKFRQRLREQRILDAARKYLLRGREEGRISFYLNKQAAYVGKVSFCSFKYGESPLGAITVSIEARDVDAVISWLAPRTVRGVPVEEVSEAPDP